MLGRENSDVIQTSGNKDVAGWENSNLIQSENELRDDGGKFKKYEFLPFFHLFSKLFFDLIGGCLEID